MSIRASSLLQPLLFNRLCAVETACSWSTPTVCWIRTVCVNTSRSCRPTWSSCRESWRGRGRGARSRWSTATPVWTVWVKSTSARRARRPFPRRMYQSLFLFSSPTFPCAARTSVMALAAPLDWIWDPRSMAAICHCKRLMLVWYYLLFFFLMDCGMKELHIYCYECCYYMLKECNCLYLFSLSESEVDYATFGMLAPVQRLWLITFYILLQHRRPLVRLMRTLRVSDWSKRIHVCECSMHSPSVELFECTLP